MKLDVWVVSSRMPSDARGMGGVSTGGGTIGSVQLNCTGSGEGNGVVVGVCTADCEMRSDRSWSMGGLVGSPKTKWERGSIRLWVKSYPCQAPSRKVAERSIGPTRLVMVRLTSEYVAWAWIWAMIMAKPAIIVGVAPFSKVS